MCKNEPDQKEGADAENTFPYIGRNLYEGLFNIYRTDRRMRCEKERRNVKRLEKKMEIL